MLSRRIAQPATRATHPFSITRQAKTAAGVIVQFLTAQLAAPTAACVTHAIPPCILSTVQESVRLVLTLGLARSVQVRLSAFLAPAQAMRSIR